MICPEAIDPAALLVRFSEANRAAGAVVSFTGVVRGGDGVEAIELDHHASYSAKVIGAIGDEAKARFDISDCLVAHRVGRVAAGEPIVFVAAAATHRRAAFEAVDYLMDRLKTEAPLWKREIGADGGGKWIEARGADWVDAARWGVQDADR
ncbi:molybdenum cofactor biosynthesis protein MoaE [Sphingomonas sp. RB1R13]|uniref:molybdenum cofactor biosynthesis protein MoaE n=1 Tax=Sphingomonas sp. RB1R13 TaxID=3096159 RepID=UPI002FCB07C8